MAVRYKGSSGRLAGGQRRPWTRWAPPPRPPESDPEHRRAMLRTERDRLLSTYTMLTRVAPDHIAVPEVTERREERALTHERRAGLPPSDRVTGEGAEAAHPGQTLPTAAGL